jgi:uncharacterized membrane protein SirB2
VVVEVEQVLVDGLVVEAEAVVPLVLFVVVFFLQLLVVEAEAVEVLTIEEHIVETLLIPGIHTIMQLFSPSVVVVVATVLTTVAAVAVAVADQADLFLVELPDLITIEVV